MSDVYDPNYGDERMCKCGHAYHWHFNPEKGYASWGCFFAYNCDCERFEESVEQVVDLYQGRVRRRVK